MIGINANQIRAAVECIVRVDDQEIKELYPFLREVQVQMTRKAATVCTLTFDSFRKENGEWTVQDSGLLAPWKKIRIEAAFAMETQEVMRGYIRNIKCSYPQDMSAASVVVTGQDESLRLDREHISKVWKKKRKSNDQEKINIHYRESEQMTDRDIVLEIAEMARLEWNPEDIDCGQKHSAVNQDETPIRFLRKMAIANGYELYVRKGRLHFHAPKLNVNPPELKGNVQPTIMVYAGAATNCLEFNVDNDGHRPEKVLISWAAEPGIRKKPLTVTPNLEPLGEKPVQSGDINLGPFAWKMRSPVGASFAEVRARAQAIANKNNWKIVAEGELDGALYGHVLLNYELVCIDGTGSTNNGIYYVDEVTHIFSTEGYRQRFKLLRNATGQRAS